MSAAATAASASPAAIQAAASACLWPEPAWITEAVERGWEWARIAWVRAAAAPGAWFDAVKANAAVALWPKVFRLTEDRFAGKPFLLNLWQEVVVRLLLGWKAPIEIADEDGAGNRIVHVRLFRRLMLWVPRKNGKSEFLAALAILFFAIEGTMGGQGFVFARDEKQAKIVFDKMKAMLAQSPALAARSKPFKKSIWIPQIRALFELLSGKAEGKHGRSPTVIVGDEMHEWETLDLASTLRQGTGARLQPIELYASTAGLKSAQVGYGLFEESASIMDGRIVDPSTLVVMFAANDNDDWRDEGVWRRVNPSLGISPTLQFLRREAAIAADNPRAEAHFRRYHLNQWVEALVRWINLRRWDACAPDATAWLRYPQELAGRKCFGAFDVSSTQDITALIWLFPPEAADEGWRIAARFWCPEESIMRRSRADRVQYDRYLAMGALEQTPGDYVDQNYVQQAIEEGLTLYDVQNIGFDPWNARKLVADLHKAGADEALLVEMRQGIQTLGEPSKHFERLVYSGSLDHGGHPVLRWMAGNAIVRFDENMNFAPAKKRSAEKIDGIVAAVMACGLAFAGVEDRPDLDDYLKNVVMAA